MGAGLKVFILGPARSGTSVMFYAMQSVMGLDGEGESHIMPGFQRVVFTFARYAEGFRLAEGVMANRLDPNAFRKLVIEHVRDVYSDIFPTGAFVDKTPGAEAIAGIPLIRDCFPDAKIIIMRRSGIEVVQSHIRKFEVEFKEACQAWVASMGAIKEIRGTTADVLELEQNDLASAPEAAAAQVAAYLGQSEKMEEVARFLAANRMDRVSQHEWGTQVLLADMSWTTQEREMFWEICGNHMRQFGYTM